MGFFNKDKDFYIRPIGGDIRWRDDGQMPTQDVGMPLWDGAWLRYSNRLSPRLWLVATDEPVVVEIATEKPEE